MKVTYTETVVREYTIEVDIPEDSDYESIEELSRKKLFSEIALNGWDDETVFECTYRKAD